MTVVINDLLPRLKGAKRSGNGYIACCPAHDDKNVSLSITEGESGRVLLHCHAGCDTQNVAGTLGLAIRDLMGEQKPQYSGAVEVARYRYGQFEKVRKSDKSFYWAPKLNGVDPGLYNAAILEASDHVFVVEGEKDVETLKKCGLPAVCSAFGQVTVTSGGVNITPFSRASVQVINLLAAYPKLQAHGDISDVYVA